MSDKPVGLSSITPQAFGVGAWLLNPDSCHMASATIPAGEAAMVSGTVLGKVTATGKYVKYDDTKSDGREVAVAFLASGVDPSDYDQVVSIVEGNAHIDYAKLPSTSGIDANAKTDLAAKVCWLNDVKS